MSVGHGLVRLSVNVTSGLLEFALAWIPETIIFDK
jgi:hypothetical protein